MIDSIDKQEPQPLEAYDIVSDLGPDGRGIPWDKMDPSEEAIQSLSAEVHNSRDYFHPKICIKSAAIFKTLCSVLQLKLYGKRAVYKDTKLQERGGKIFERDGILYNCAFSRCDLGRKLNE